MNALVMIGQVLLGLSILVFVHELGHFLFARLFGIRVEKFYLFFDFGGFKLLHFKIGETEYGIGWLPLGGYCKIAGMIDESMDKTQSSHEPQPWEYRSKPAWQRFFVATGGVIMNIITGIVIFTAILQHDGSYLSTREVNRYGIYAYPTAREIGFRSGDIIYGTREKMAERFTDAMPVGVLMGGKIKVERNGEELWIDIPADTYRRLSQEGEGFPLFDACNYPTVVKETAPGGGAGAAGLESGDRIFSLDGEAVPSFGCFREKMRSHRNDTVALGIIRGGDSLCLAVAADSNGTVGIYTDFPLQLSEYGFGEALRYGTVDALNMIWVNARGLGRVISGQEKAKESIQGPIGIAKVYGSIWNWFRFWYITGMLSMALALMNILPIPGLDGGHMMFALYEMLTRRKVSEKFMERAQLVGMTLIMLLFVLIIFNDLSRLFFK